MQEFFDFVKKISIILTYRGCTSTFYDDICKYMLSDDVINNAFLIYDRTCMSKQHSTIFVNNKPLDSTTLQSLVVLDQMNQEDQEIMSHCFDAFDENYVVSKSMYDEFNNYVIWKWKRPSDYVYQKLILEIHFKVMMHRIYFIWKSNPFEYEYDIKEFNDKLNDNLYVKIINEQYTFDTVYSTMLSIIIKMFNTIDNIITYKYIFVFMEMLIRKYANISIYV